MLKNMKKISAIKKHLSLKESPQINDQFFSFKNGDIWFVGDKIEFKQFLSRYNNKEVDWILKKGEEVQGFYIILVATKAYSLSELLPKEPFQMVEKESNILFHIPHDSLSIPMEFEKDYVINNLTQEALIMSDWKVSELIWEELYSHSHLKFNYSRIFLDVERYKDDCKENMTQFGMGKCYYKTSDSKLLRDISKETRKYCENLFDEYHKALKGKSYHLLEKYGEDAIIIDLHSYPDEDRWYEKKEHKPDICIGFNSDAELQIATLLKKVFEEFGFSVLFNNPYSGSLKPEGIEIKSVMIEVNRKLYLTEEYQYLENRDLKAALSKAVEAIKK